MNKILFFPNSIFLLKIVGHALNSTPQKFCIAYDVFEGTWPHLRVDAIISFYLCIIPDKNYGTRFPYIKEKFRFSWSTKFLQPTSSDAYLGERKRQNVGWMARHSLVFSHWFPWLPSQELVMQCFEVVYLVFSFKFSWFIFLSNLHQSSVQLLVVRRHKGFDLYGLNIPRTSYSSFESHLRKNVPKYWVPDQPKHQKCPIQHHQHCTWRETCSDTVRLINCKIVTGTTGLSSEYGGLWLTNR